MILLSKKVISNQEENERFILLQLDLCLIMFSYGEVI